MPTQGLWIKILIPKQMLQKLPITPAQVKAGSIPQNLLNEIRQNIFLKTKTKLLKNYATK